MSNEIPKAYDPTAIESKWAEFWVKERLFSLPTSAVSPQDDVFTLLLPPPNVTGRLHMGHMLNQTEMDIIIRWKRMSGAKTLWLPGTDHAGIATQMMVERQLASEGKKRTELGREKFVERVWEWRQHYGGAILDQMKRLGASVDWDREFFTMDENLSRAVREAFVRLHEAGKIYRGTYIVNWCPRCGTAISDLEVVHEEVAGKLYEISYPVVGGKEFITVATTRPETMLGDTAIAVNPNDERYKHLIGRTVRIPITTPEREIPIIADEWANPEFGTGAVKVTPAHDPNDFAIGQRHNLLQLNVMDEAAHMNANAGKYAGLDRYAARKEVLANLESMGLLVAVKDHMLSVGKCDRCKTVVEPRLSEQWFLKVEGDIALRAIEAVKRGHIKVTPENYRTIYLNWMENIHDWCISRQLWWGHRIPAWHCDACKKITVAREAPKTCSHCGSDQLWQDTDVLDTWFSSALLPFTCFGWPDKTKDLETFYPTTLLITGFDILFFWVARMIMMGCWFMGDEDKLDLNSASGDAKLKQSVPFENVYIHALVRDADRQKMSKTKGNVVDPIEIIERFGTDAVRFTLASMAAPGTDIAFSEERTQGYRAFANKIWNASRFVFMNVDRARQAGWWSIDEWLKVGDSTKTTLEDRWILSRWYRTAAEINRTLTEYRFDEAATTIYDFFWKDYCDWYVEMIKPRLASESVEEQKLALFTAMGVLEGSLRLLAPFMPFLTEELFHAIYQGNAPSKSIALVGFPGSEAEQFDEKSEQEMALLQKLVTDIRYLRAEQGVPPKEAVPVQIDIHSKDSIQSTFNANATVIRRLANASELVFTPITQADGVSRNPSFDVRLDFKKNPAAERDRISKDLKKFETELANAQRNLGNEQFLAKAPAKVVEGIRKREAELNVLIEKSRNALAELG